MDAQCSELCLLTPAGIKALADELECYACFSAQEGGIGLPAAESRIVAYIDYRDAGRLKPATVSKRLSSLAVPHHLLGASSPLGARVVRDALRRLSYGEDVGQGLAM